MSDFRKLQNHRVDLEEIIAFSVYTCNKREKGYHDKIYLYPRSRPKDSFEIYYYIGEDDKLFEEAVQMLDEYFDVKTEEESRILP